MSQSIDLFEYKEIKNTVTSDASDPVFDVADWDMSEFDKAELLITVTIEGGSSSSSSSDEEYSQYWSYVPLYGYPDEAVYFHGEADVVYVGETHKVVDVAHNPNFAIKVLEGETNTLPTRIRIVMRPISKCEYCAPVTFRCS